MSECITAAEFVTRSRPVRRSKYRNKRVTVDGIAFDSKKEAARWVVLRDLERRGEISNLERQPKFYLEGRDGQLRGSSGRLLFYKADFQFVDWRENGVKVVEDVKGVETDVFKLKRSILAAQGVEITTT